MSSIEYSYAFVKYCRSIVTSTENSFNAGKYAKVLFDNGIGVHSGSSVIFSPTDKLLIVSLIRRNTGQDLSTIESNKFDRISVAKQAISEKLGADPVSTDWILIKPLTTTTINSNVISLPFGSHIQVDYKKIDFSNLHIVIIENLAAFEAIGEGEYNFLPPNTVAIYRGHYIQNPSEYSDGIYCMNIQSVMSSVLEKRGFLSIGCFFDFDAAGLCMATQFSPDYLILPDIQDLTNKSLAGSKIDYLNQQRQMSSLLSHLKFRQLDEFIKFLNEGEQTYTQERLLAHSIKMKRVDFLIN